MSQDNLETGAILISRSFCKSELFQSKPHAWTKIFLYIITNVHHASKGRFRRGENFFSYAEIRLNCHVTKGQLEGCLRYLRDKTQIKTQKSTRGIIISLLEYDVYQTLDNYRIDRKKDAPQDAHKTKRRQPQDEEATLKIKNESIKKLNNEKTSPKKSEISRVQKKSGENNFSKKSLELAEMFFGFAGKRFLELCPQFAEKQTELLETWAEELEKLHRIDGLDFSQVEFLINWLFTSDSENALFWRRQIASPTKLRRKNRDDSPYWRVLVDRMRQEAEQFSIETREYSL